MKPVHPDLLLLAAAALAIASCSSSSPAQETAAASSTAKATPIPKLSIYSADPKAPGEVGENFTGPGRVTGRYPTPGNDRLRSVSAVTFDPGGRTRWHTHPYGQLLVVTDGEGWIQVEGEPVRAMKLGDMVWTAPNVAHWHGATRTTGVTHAAISERSDHADVVWMHPVAEADYHGPR